LSLIHWTALEMCSFSEKVDLIMNI